VDHDWWIGIGVWLIRERGYIFIDAVDKANKVQEASAIFGVGDTMVRPSMIQKVMKDNPGLGDAFYNG